MHDDNLEAPCPTCGKDTCESFIGGPCLSVSNVYTTGYWVGTGISYDPVKWIPSKDYIKLDRNLYPDYGWVFYNYDNESK